MRGTTGFLLTCVAIIMCDVPAAVAQGAGSWPISDFEVIQGEPFEPDSLLRNLSRVPMAFDIDTVDPVEVTHPLTPAMKEDMESFLADVAVLLQQWGFPPPNTLPRGDAYPVFYTNIPEGAEASGLYDMVSRNRPLIPEVNVIFVDADSVADENGVTPFGYAVLAHELFHAVQYATPFFRNHPDRNPWLDEAQADAVAYDLARMLRPDAFNRLDNPWKTWGRRDYSAELVVTRDEDDDGPAPAKAYNTSSLWRFLAEVDQRRRSPRYAVPVGPEVHAVNYSYLAYFLARTINAEDDGNGELAWLDAMTRTYPQFHRPFRDLYAQFIAAYSAYGENRVADTNGAGSRERLRRDWLEGSFGQRDAATGDYASDGAGCVQAQLSPDQRRARALLVMKRTAAACIELDIDGFGDEQSVVLDMSATDSAKLQQLGVGVAGEPRTATVEFIANRGEDARTRFVYRLPGDDVSTLVVANMAAAPAETVDQTAVIYFTIGGHEIAGVDPPTGEDAAGGGEPSATEDPEEATRRRMAEAAGRVTSNGPFAAGARRRESSGQTQVWLTLVPDAGNVLNEVNATGSSAAQAIGSDVAGDELQRRMMEFMGATDAIAATDGAGIRLRFPLIDYGFTGGFNNAEIRFSRPQARDLEALGADYEPNGEVVIEEYSPDFMSGSFSGALVNPDERSDGPPTVVRNVSGRFWVGSPWMTDDRVEIEPSDTLAEDIMNDLLAQAPGSAVPGFADALGAPEPPPTEDGADGAPPPPGPGGAGFSVEGACDCSCTTYARVQALSERSSRPGFSPTPEDNALLACTFQCMTEYAACAR